MTTTLYTNTNPQSCHGIRVVSARVPVGQWPATPRAVLYCGHTRGRVSGLRPRYLIEWAVRADDPAMLQSIVRLYMVDKWDFAEIGGVCRALLDAVPRHLKPDELIGPSCMLRVVRNKHRPDETVVGGHEPLPSSVAPVVLPADVCVADNIWDVPAERMIQLGLSGECMDWQAKVVHRRGLI